LGQLSEDSSTQHTFPPFTLQDHMFEGTEESEGMEESPCEEKDACISNLHRWNFGKAWDFI